MDKLDALLSKLEDVRDGFQRHLEKLTDDRTITAPGEDRSRTIELLKESVGSFTLALQRFKS